jgi:hypothetical protein
LHNQVKPHEIGIECKPLKSPAIFIPLTLP